MTKIILTEKLKETIVIARLVFNKIGRLQNALSVVEMRVISRVAQEQARA